MRVVAVIPARMGSSRFPGKPLASLCGRPMLQHVYEAAAQCAEIDDVIVATCDEEIAVAARAFGARVAMTSASHERATDRVAEACASEDADIVVMVQGDEPMIRPRLIGAAVEALRSDPSVGCVNLMSPIQDEIDARDPNTIKVVVNRDGDAMYFSRARVPLAGASGSAGTGCFKQVCVMAFRRAALDQFSTLPATPLEAAESIDLLRFLEHGRRVRMVRVDTVTHAVDTPSDLQRVEALMATATRVS